MKPSHYTSPRQLRDGTWSHGSTTQGYRRSASFSRTCDAGHRAVLWACFIILAGLGLAAYCGVLQ